MDRRFEAQTAELAEQRRETRERFEAMGGRFEAVLDVLADQRSWVGTVVGGLQNRAGRNLENAVAGTLRVALDLRDVKPEDIELRRKFVDEQGRIGPAGRSYEFDLWIDDGRTTIFEIKSTPEEDDVLRFNDKAEMARQALGLESIDKVLVTLEKPQGLQALCQSLGIQLV